MNAVGAIRVSTVKQGMNGDSPEDQQRQIEQYASSHDITISKFFVFLESASKEQQPMQEVVNYCKNKKNNIQQVIIKSIDRFTRGGSELYSILKNQLDDNNVALVDIYGVISGQKVNTLEHLGISYKWSVFSPSKKSEILEAERAKDEVRDIQTRMIGAQIRYARMGYWVRRSLYGFNNIRMETREGKRCVLEANCAEAPFIVKMFELRAQGTLDDNQIIERLNDLGFKTRESYVRDKRDRTKIIRTIGGYDLSLKTFWKIVANPVYAGINPEKWTQDSPVRCRFDGLVSVELWNAANRGKQTIIEDGEEVRIVKRKIAYNLKNKGTRNPDFPFKRIVMCPECRQPLYGSTSKGRHGGHYPAYHCDHRGHYFRKPKKEFDGTIERFVQSIEVRPEYIDDLIIKLREKLDKQLMTQHDESVTIDIRIANLQDQIRRTVQRISVSGSETTIKYMEESIETMEAEIIELKEKRMSTPKQTPNNFDKATGYLKYYLENLDRLLLNYDNPVLQAKYFGVIFNKAPAYTDIVSGTLNLDKITGVNSLFRTKTPLDNTHGWDGGVRTPEYWYQKPAPYHLATSQCPLFYNTLTLLYR